MTKKEAACVGGDSRFAFLPEHEHDKAVREQERKLARMTGRLAKLDPDEDKGFVTLLCEVERVTKINTANGETAYFNVTELTLAELREIAAEMKNAGAPLSANKFSGLTVLRREVRKYLDWEPEESSEEEETEPETETETA